MLFLREPSEEKIHGVLREQHNASFSYDEVGATSESVPRGYNADHNRVRLGEGEETFVRAKKAIRGWKMFDLGWVRIFPQGSSVERGTTVAVVARHYGFWSVNVSRVVYEIEDEKDGVRRFGFAYGTLPEHAERGEERFTIEWSGEDDSVYYDILAFSRPNHPLIRIGYPFARAAQRRFARDSLSVMVRAVGG